MRTTDGGTTWHPQYLGANEPAGGLVALGRNSAVARVAGDLIWTDAGGETGQPAALALEVRPRPALSRRVVLVTGRLRPRLEATVVISRFTPREGWQTKRVVTSSDGTFRTGWSAPRGARFVARWFGTSGQTGAGSAVAKPGERSAR